MKRVFTVFLFASLSLLAADGQKVSKYMSKVYNEGKGFDVQVSTVMYNYTKEHQYFPLIVQVHNWTEANVQVSVDQFTLIDEQGNVYHPITAEEYLENHVVQGRRNYDYLSRRAATGIESKPGLWYIERTNFYPTHNIKGARGSAVRSVSLEANHYCIDWLYFGALPPGNYKLQFESGGETLTMPVFL